MKKCAIHLLVFCMFLNLSTVDAFADKVCIKISNKNRITRKVVDSTLNCQRGFTLIVDTNVLVGPRGIQGVQGADGALRVFGDGSDGDVTFSSSTTLSSSSAQFNNITINSGVTLTVLPGMTIRCTGTLTNRGTITVSPNINGGAADLAGANLFSPAVSYPGAGIAYSTPGTGAFGTNTAILFGGPGAAGLGIVAGALPILQPALLGGGGGAGSLNGGAGGSGGGALRILCKNDITLQAGSIINADAALASSGGGGGGGGLVVLGAGNLITWAGAISANGSAGSEATAASGAGGGGGGGIIQVIAPSVNKTGTESIAAGTGGAAQVAGTVSTSPRMGGGGGGASGGNGGPGGNVNSNGSATAGQDGSAGVSSSILASPISLVL